MSGTDQRSHNNRPIICFLRQGSLAYKVAQAKDGKCPTLCDLTSHQQTVARNCKKKKKRRQKAARTRVTWKLLGGDPLKEVFLGSFWTHHSLVVDLNHLVACVDLLTLVGWRLQRHRETGRQEEQRQRSESHWRAWSSLLDYRTDPTQETTESVWKVEEKIQKGISLNFLNGPIRFVTVRLATVQSGASYLSKERLPARRKSEYKVCNPTNPVGGEARNMSTAP